MPSLAQKTLPFEPPITAKLACGSVKQVGMAF
jgi:hypothetical protein